MTSLAVIVFWNVLGQNAILSFLVLMGSLLAEHYLMPSVIGNRIVSLPQCCQPEFYERWLFETYECLQGD